MIALLTPGQFNSAYFEHSFLADEMGIPVGVAREGLASFQGVQRRFTLRGEAGGVTVVDDYGHHPAEVRATLAAAREVSEEAAAPAASRPAARASARPASAESAWPSSGDPASV